MYYGRSEKSFALLLVYVYGIQMGVTLASSQAKIQSEEFIPADFHRFVTERFGRQYPDGGKGWMTFVHENTSSDEEAFDLFFELRREYEKTKTG